MQAKAPELPSRRTVMAGPVVAAVTLVAAIVATRSAGVPFRDPDHVAAKYVVMVGLAVLMLVMLDIALRAGLRSGTKRPSRAAMRSVRHARWGWYRGAAAAASLVSFYVSYLAYGNIKSVVPLLRPGDAFDRQLDDLDRALFFGHDPSDLLHTLLGTGFQTHILSAAYVVFIVFLPLSLALALVFSRNLRNGLFIATALSVNWTLGAATYLMVPALGPIYARPSTFTDLPSSETTHLQSVLLVHRLEFLHDPAAAGTGQAIAAFVSLHCSMTFTAVVAAHLLGLGRRLRVTLWMVFVITITDTVYLGWHYVVDDIAGVAVALSALLLARLLTGVDLTAARRRRSMRESASA